MHSCSWHLSGESRSCCHPFASCLTPPFTRSTTIDHCCGSFGHIGGFATRNYWKSCFDGNPRHSDSRLANDGVHLQIFEHMATQEDL